MATVQGKFVGGLLLPGDETGDCFKFTQNLATLAAQRGVQSRYGTKIERQQPSRGQSRRQIDGVVVDAATLKADSYLVALGSYSPLLLKGVGIRIPVYPVKGYSITVPITDATGAPESSVMDESHKVAVTRLGDRIRVGGTAELSGYTVKLHDARRAPPDAGACGHRPVPARRRCVACRVLVRSAPDDARRHTGARRHAPVLAIVAGRCFAGNAAQLGCSDVIIATKRSNIGMGGALMLEGGGLGVFKPEQIGPSDVQSANGVIDLLVEDEAAAVAAARQYLTSFQGSIAAWAQGRPRLAAHRAARKPRARLQPSARSCKAWPTPVRCWNCVPVLVPGS